MWCDNFGIDLNQGSLCRIVCTHLILYAFIVNCSYYYITIANFVVILYQWIHSDNYGCLL